jgi:hypothetical protein
MRQNIGYKLLIAIGIFLTTIAFASAAVPGGANITNNVTRATMINPVAHATTLTSGNISQANLDTNQSTFRWAGLLGNVTGKIILGDSTSAVLFNWTALGNLVYASNVAAPAWGTLADANGAAVTGVFGYLTGGAGVSDDYADTFIGPSQSIGSNIFTALNSDYATTGTTGTSVWKTYSLTDGLNIVFAGKVVENGNAYTGEPADYQMIIPEDGTNANIASTSWYLWVELV